MTQWMLLVAVGVGPRCFEEKSSYDLRVDPLADLSSWVRALSSGAEDLEARGLAGMQGLAEAVEAGRALDRLLGHALYWGLVDGHLEGCSGAEELVKRFEALPEKIEVRGRPLSVREAAVRWGKALARVEPAFRESVWPEHEQELRARLSKLEESFLPEQQECLEFLFAGLAVTDPRHVLPVYLVVEAPAPGGVTFLREGGGGLSFVAVKDVPDGLLMETIVHESLHSVDILTRDQSTVFVQLEEKLLASGVGPRDPRLRDAPHLVMFLQSAAAVRKLWLPEHQDYGLVFGVYERTSPRHEGLRAIWNERLDEDLSVEEAVGEMVAIWTESRS